MQLTRGNLIDYYYITDPQDLPQVIKAFAEQKIIAVDTETYALENGYLKSSALDTHTSKIRLLQLNYPGNPHPYIIDCLKIPLAKVQPLVDQILGDAKIRKLAFNFPFDLKVIKKNFGLWLENAWCVQIMMQLAGGASGFKWRQSMGYSYKALARDMFSIHLDKIGGASDWRDPALTPEQLEYAALDVGAPKSSKLSSILIAGYQLYRKLLTAPLPQGFDMTNSLKIEQEAMVEIARMEYTGLPVNPKFIKAFIPAVTQELTAQEIKLAKYLKLPVIQEIDQSSIVPKINYSLDEKTKTLLRSPTKLIDLIAQACRYFQDELTSLDSKSLDQVLASLKNARVTASAPEIIAIDYDLSLFKELLELKKIQKMLDKDWLHLINPVTNCIHAGYRTIGTSTGRMSSSGSLFGVKFNAQQIPRKKIVIEIDPKDFTAGNSLIL